MQIWLFFQKQLETNLLEETLKCLVFSWALTFSDADAANKFY